MRHLNTLKLNENIIPRKKGTIARELIVLFLSSVHLDFQSYFLNSFGHLHYAVALMYNVLRASHFTLFLVTLNYSCVIFNAMMPYI